MLCYLEQFLQVMEYAKTRRTSGLRHGQGVPKMDTPLHVQCYGYIKTEKRRREYGWRGENLRFVSLMA